MDNVLNQIRSNILSYSQNTSYIMLVFQLKPTCYSRQEFVKIAASIQLSKNLVKIHGVRLELNPSLIIVKSSNLLCLPSTTHKTSLLRPEFEHDSYSGSVAEDVGTQKVVLTVLATDQDSGDNGDVVYSLQGNNLPFAIRVSFLVRFAE